MATSEICSAQTLRNAESYMAYVEKRYGNNEAGAPQPEPEEGKRRWTALERVRYEQVTTHRGRGVSVSDVGKRRFGAESKLEEHPRLSPLHRSVSLPMDTAIQLTPGEEKRQLAALFQGDNPSTELLKIILHSDQQIEFEEDDEVFDALVTAIRELIGGASEVERRKLFTHLADLSLYPGAHRFICTLFEELEGDKEYLEILVELHTQQGVLEQSLPSFLAIALEGEKGDCQSFRRSDHFAYFFSGAVVRYILRDQLQGLVSELRGRLNFTYDPSSSHSVETISRICQEMFPRLFGLLTSSPKINSILQTGCINPILHHFGSSEEAIEDLVKLGIIDMLFLRGICPTLAKPPEDEGTWRNATRTGIRFSSALMSFVAGKLPQSSQGSIREIWQRTFDPMRGAFEGLLEHFTGERDTDR